MVQTVATNWWALAVAVVTNFVIGGIWYSPTLFIKPWLAMSGVNKAEFDKRTADGAGGRFVRFDGDGVCAGPCHPVCGRRQPGTGAAGDVLVLAGFFLLPR
jgi:hypothetical protein